MLIIVFKEYKNNNLSLNVKVKSIFPPLHIPMHRLFSHIFPRAQT